MRESIFEGKVILSRERRVADSLARNAAGECRVYVNYITAASVKADTDCRSWLSGSMGSL